MFRCADPGVDGVADRAAAEPERVLHRRRHRAARLGDLGQRVRVVHLQDQRHLPGKPVGHRLEEAERGRVGVAPRIDGRAARGSRDRTPAGSARTSERDRARSPGRPGRITNRPVPASVPVFIIRNRFAFTPGVSEPYQDRICFTRSVAGIGPRYHRRRDRNHRPKLAPQPGCAGEPALHAARVAFVLRVRTKGRQRLVQQRAGSLRIELARPEDASKRELRFRSLRRPAAVLGPQRHHSLERARPPRRDGSRPRARRRARTIRWPRR